MPDEHRQDSRVDLLQMSVLTIQEEMGQVWEMMLCILQTLEDDWPAPLVQGEAPALGEAPAEHAQAEGRGGDQPPIYPLDQPLHNLAPELSAPVQPHLEVAFDGWASKVNFFVIQVMEFLCRRGTFIQDEGSRVCYLVYRLEGAAADWFVSMYESNALELRTVWGFV